MRCHMRVSVVAFAGAALLLAACSTSPDRPELRSAGNRVAKSSGVPDLDGLPDLIVDSKTTQNNWIHRVEDLPANFCSVQEGGITPGTHEILRFTVTTPNIGDGDNYIGSPLDHIDPNRDGNYSDSDGLYESATCHNHFHFKHYATYQLIGA